MSFAKSTAFDSTRAFAREGYEFISKECDKLGVDAFATRLALKPVVCMRGDEAARLFYRGGAFSRVATLPPTAALLLRGKGTVNALQGAAHLWRKQMFLSMMRKERVALLMADVEAQWRTALEAWKYRDRIVLHDEVRRVFCRAIFRWTGIPDGENLEKRLRELASMVDHAASFGPRVVVALALRARCNRWARSVIERARNGMLTLDPDCPLFVLAHHRNEQGVVLPAQAAANELINILRPVVSTARFVVFAGMALHDHPYLKDALRGGEDGALERFAHEVRRVYPYCPAVGGRALETLDFRGERIEKDALVLFDLYGTNHDERIWKNASTFDPDRFLAQPPTQFTFVPQGGGEYLRDHRCAGEPIVIGLLKQCTALLVSSMSYDVPPQDLTVDLKRFPALPASGFVMTNIRDIA